MRIKNRWMIISILSLAPLIGEVEEQSAQSVEQVGYTEEEGDVADSSAKQRNDIDFYDKNRDQVRERRRREAIRAYRAAQVEQACDSSQEDCSRN